MSMVLDPTSERSIPERARVPRPTSLRGRSVALLDISKARGNVFLDRIEERLLADGCKVQRFAKPTFSKPAPIEVRQQIASSCEVLIEALAD
jgi:hypothetical protein